MTTKIYLNVVEDADPVNDTILSIDKLEPTFNGPDDEISLAVNASL